MWIEIKYKTGGKFLINTSLISSIDVEGDGLHLNYTNKPPLIIYTLSEDEAEALYEGFVMVLNGIDFYFGDEGASIKPMMKSKNEAFYKHMMLKEVLGDRK